MQNTGTQQDIRVLVVEDDASLSDVVCTFLGKHQMVCTPAFSGSEALLLLDRAENKTDRATGNTVSQRRFDVVICDLMLPGVSGEEVVAAVRESLGNIPVLVTSARSEVDRRIALLRCGADDYLVKPFDLEELLARIEVQLRLRAESPLNNSDKTAASPQHESSEQVLCIGPWKLSPATREFIVNGRSLRLTRTEFDMLAAMMRQPTRVFTKRDLYLAACHDTEIADIAASGVTLADEKTVSTHIANLRAKLKDSGTDNMIQTVWGIGFKLNSASQS
ncbi:response regulator transcription factor [Olsenella sp. Marseille-QA0557]|uniref:response regulator transcription factor n=1 Tax=Olsenella sp. Marseille-QA0557 TaxID=3378782 RepID=UPI003D09F845